MGHAVSRHATIEASPLVSQAKGVCVFISSNSSTYYRSSQPWGTFAFLERNWWNYSPCLKKLSQGTTRAQSLTRKSHFSGCLNKKNAGKSSHPQPSFHIITIWIYSLAVFMRFWRASSLLLLPLPSLRNGFRTLNLLSFPWRWLCKILMHSFVYHSYYFYLFIVRKARSNCWLGIAVRLWVWLSLINLSNASFDFENVYLFLLQAFF